LYHIQSVFEMLRIFSLATLFVVLSAMTAIAQKPVLVIGSDDAQFEQWQLEYGTQLLTVSGDDIKIAYGLWVDMLKAMETYDTQLPQFDLNGINAWFYVFFEADGRIGHIAYHLKPNSKFVKEEAMTMFLESFIRQYKLPLNALASGKFSHYSGAFFPMTSLNSVNK
jgi:hypothetical protein